MRITSALAQTVLFDTRSDATRLQTERIVKRVGCLSILIILLSSCLFADQIVLKNGDRLTGTIVKSDGKVLIIKSDLAGDVTVKFDDVQSVTSAGDLNVTLGGKTVVGPVTTNGDNIVVATKSGTPVAAPKSSVTLIRSPAEQAAYEKSLHPGFGEGWAGGLNLGFAVTRGNSEAKNLNIAFGAVRTGFHDKLSLYTNSVYATNDLSTASPHTTANTIGGGLRYDHDFSARTFWFVNADFLSNSLQELNLRSTFGGGIGLHVIKTPVTTLDLLAGLNYTHESYSAFVLPTAPQRRSRPRATAWQASRSVIPSRTRSGKVPTLSKASSSIRTSATHHNTAALSISVQSQNSTSGWVGKTRSGIFMSATHRLEQRRMTCYFRPA